MARPRPLPSFHHFRSRLSRRSCRENLRGCPCRCPQPCIPLRSGREVPGVDDDFSARRVTDRVGNQILDDAFQKTGIRVCDQLIRDAVDEASTGGSSDWIQIVDQPFHERPKFGLAPFQFYSYFGLEAGVLLNDFADEFFEVHHVASQSLEHSSHFRSQSQLVKAISPGLFPLTKWHSVACASRERRMPDTLPDAAARLGRDGSQRFAPRARWPDRTPG